MIELLGQFKGSPVVALIAALVAALALTPLVRVLAIRCKALATQDERRIQSAAIPEWGGLAVFAAIALAALLWRQPTLGDIRPLAPSSSLSDILFTKATVHLSLSFFGCGLLMLLLGMADDRFEIKPHWKLLGQLVVAALLWAGGVRIQTIPFTAGTQVLAVPLSFVVTVFWVLLLTNAVNLIDGVDGLATGICVIAAGTLMLLEWHRAPWAAAVAGSVCGACLGFLRYNLPPARIYLGDTGAMLLGFWLAALAMAAASKTVAATTMLLPILVLGVPLADTIWAIIRRLRAGQPIWRGDRGHLHHRLLARGFPPAKVLFLLYGVSILLGAVALMWQRLITN
jgi:UDP-GlcNAc:undecaprenyl-phosphate GlcNAc-1-phosphate transferase